MLRIFTLATVFAITGQIAAHAQLQVQGPSIDDAINNGVEYTDYYEHMYEAKHPFYNKNTYTLGDVTYFGRHYEHIMLKYDVIKDELITIYTDGITPITLFPEQVDSFRIYNQTFVHMDDPASGLPKGYYAQLFEGNNVVMYARYTKSVLPQQYVNGGLYDVVSDHDYFYLKQNGVYHSFKSIKGLGELMNVSKKDTKNFERTNDQQERAVRFSDYARYVSSK